MTAEQPDFRPFEPRRLVPGGPGVALTGPGTLYRAGQLVEEGEVGDRPADPDRTATVIQLAGLKR